MWLATACIQYKEQDVALGIVGCHIDTSSPNWFSTTDVTKTVVCAILYVDAGCPLLLIRVTPDWLQQVSFHIIHNHNV